MWLCNEPTRSKVLFGLDSVLSSRSTMCLWCCMVPRAVALTGPGSRLPRVGARSLSVRVVAWKGGGFPQRVDLAAPLHSPFLRSVPAIQQKSESSHERCSSLLSYIKPPIPLRNCSRRIFPRQRLRKNLVPKSPKQRKPTRLLSRRWKSSGVACRVFEKARNLLQRGDEAPADCPLVC
jgi:hypothetical protein